jgi:hypothetical protein
MRRNKTYLRTTSFFSLHHLHWHEKAHAIMPFHLKINGFFEIIIIVNIWIIVFELHKNIYDPLEA